MSCSICKNNATHQDDDGQLYCPNHRKLRLHRIVHYLPTCEMEGCDVIATYCPPEDRRRRTRCSLHATMAHERFASVLCSEFLCKKKGNMVHNATFWCKAHAPLHAKKESVCAADTCNARALWVEPNQTQTCDLHRSDDAQPRSRRFCKCGAIAYFASTDYRTVYCGQCRPMESITPSRLKCHECHHKFACAKDAQGRMIYCRSCCRKLLGAAYPTNEHVQEFLLMRRIEYRIAQSKKFLEEISHDRLKEDS